MSPRVCVATFCFLILSTALAVSQGTKVSSRCGRQLDARFPGQHHNVFLRRPGFSKIAFSAANPSFVVAAVAGANEGVIEGRENPVNKNRGPYYSTHAGKFWTGTTTIEPTSATTVVYNGSTQMFSLLWPLRNAFSGRQRSVPSSSQSAHESVPSW